MPWLRNIAVTMHKGLGLDYGWLRSGEGVKNVKEIIM